MLKRHAIKVLREAGLAQTDVAKRLSVSERSVRMIEAEPAVDTIDDAAERRRRRIGRPSKAEPFRSFVSEVFAKEPELLSLEVLRRARLVGYAGGKSALYALIASLRPEPVQPIVRFEGLPGEFSQHDFGEVGTRAQRAARSPSCSAPRAISDSIRTFTRSFSTASSSSGRRRARPNALAQATLR